MIYIGDLWHSLQEDNLWDEGGKILLGDKEITPDEILKELEWITNTKEGLTRETMDEFPLPIHVPFGETPLWDKPNFKGSKIIFENIHTLMGDNIVIPWKKETEKKSKADKGFMSCIVSKKDYDDNVDFFNEETTLDNLFEKFTVNENILYMPSLVVTPLMHIASLTGYTGDDMDSHDYTVNVDVDPEVLVELREATLKARCALTGEDYNEFSHLVM